MDFSASSSAKTFSFMPGVVEQPKSISVHGGLKTFSNESVSSFSSSSSPSPLPAPQTHFMEMVARIKLMQMQLMQQQYAAANSVAHGQGKQQQPQQAAISYNTVVCQEGKSSGGSDEFSSSSGGPGNVDALEEMEEGPGWFSSGGPENFDEREEEGEMERDVIIGEVEEGVLGLRGKKLPAFLLDLLGSRGYQDKISWNYGHGHSFTVHKPAEVAEMWGSTRISKKRNNGGPATVGLLTRSFKHYMGKGVLRRIAVAPGDEEQNYAFVGHPGKHADSSKLWIGFYNDSVANGMEP